MSRLRLAPALAAIALVVLAGCGSSDDSSNASAGGSTSTTAAASSSAKATVQLAETSLGDVLTDADGMTLYMFTKDSDGKSACNGQCASLWPPLTADGTPTAGDGVDEDDLGTITREDGMTQVTYYGHPLYTYGPDTKAGDVNGQNVGGVWFAVTAEGEKAGSAPASSGGGY
jgi:predicted lipoprotein with Yx(FWY)xxD motif